MCIGVAMIYVWVSIVILSVLNAAQVSTNYLLFVDSTPIFLVQVCLKFLNFLIGGIPSGYAYEPVLNFCHVLCTAVF